MSIIKVKFKAVNAKIVNVKDAIGEDAVG